MKATLLPSGNYRVQVVDGYTEDGKRIVKSFTAKRDWEALKMAEEYLESHEIHSQTPANNRNISVRQAMQMYIDTRANIIQKTTLRNYNLIVKNNLRSIMDCKLYELTPIDIQTAVNAETKSLSAKTIKNAYGLLKSTLKMFCVNINLDNIILPKVKKAEKELPDFVTIYTIIKGTSIELPCLLSAWLSLRIGEVCGLQFKDVDYQQKTLKVRRTIITTENGNEVREGCKTEKSTRTLALPEYICALIKQIPHNKSDNFIIPMTKKALYSRFIRLMDKHGIHITFHDLRHLNASVMLMLGIPDKYAMERGGWSTDHVLKSVYQQTVSAERQKVDQKIDEYFEIIINESK